MSKWIRGIYNAAANFNMSGSLRAAAGRTLGRNRELVREELNKCDEPNKSSESDKSCSATASSTGTSASCTRTPCNCRSTSASVIIGNDVIITDSSELCDTQCNKCHPTFCDHIERDYADYTASIRTEGQGSGSWIRVSNEPRDFERTNNTTRTDVEHVTGIPTGVTI